MFIIIFYIIKAEEKKNKKKKILGLSECNKREEKEKSFNIAKSIYFPLCLARVNWALTMF
jgi:hypothetical protein